MCICILNMSCNEPAWLANAIFASEIENTTGGWQLKFSQYVDTHKIVQNTNTKYQEEKYKLKKNPKYHIFLGDWEQVSKTLPVLPTVKTKRRCRQWQFVLLSISTFCLFPFLLHFVNICLLLYFCQYLSFGSSSPQFHPWGSCQSGLSRSAACFHLYSCPPPTTQIRKIRKHANTQIRRYPNTQIPQERKYC